MNWSALLIACLSFSKASSTEVAIICISALKNQVENLERHAYVTYVSIQAMSPLIRMGLNIAGVRRPQIVSREALVTREKST